MSVLEQILARKRAEVVELRRARLPSPPPQRRLVELGRARGAPLGLLTEIKLRSPSAGALSTKLSVAERAAAYERGGARAISVLTDSEFFAGAFAHLRQARDATRLPILCKDFVIDEIQLDAARAHGADLVLLIVRCLAPERVRPLVDAAHARELEPLVEVVTPEEAAIALDAGAGLIGVNARDLDTLTIDAERAADVLAALPAGVVAIHLSGLKTASDVADVARSRADAALVGEALMRADDPTPLLGELWQAAAGG